MTEKKPGKVSFFKNLMERRVPQIMCIYLGGCWGVFQFVQYLVARNGLSPHLEDLFLLLSASLIPSVFLLVYFHGKPGRDRWVKMELIGVPVNLVAAAALLIFVFQGKSLGATTEKISVRDEDGKKVEKRVAKSEFRQRIALFPFTYQDGDPGYQWLRLGVPLALSVDLDQDLFLSVANPFHSGLIEDLKKSKTPLDASFPIALCRRIAKDHHLPYFFTGTVQVTGQQVLLSSSLFETKSGRMLHQRKLSGPRLFPLIDEMTLQLKKDLQIPTLQLESVQDLPVEEILTGSLDSLKQLVAGLRAFAYSGDVSQAQTLLQKAIESDPSHALAYLHLAGVQTNANQVEAARKTLLSAANLDYKLSDRSRFELKDMSFILNGQGEKRLALLKMQTELYPDSLTAHLALGDLYLRLNQFREALQTFEILSTKAPQPEVYHPKLAWALERLGRLDEALAYHQAYVDAFPQDADGIVRLARFHFRSGAFAQAEDLFARAALLDSDPNIQEWLAKTDLRQGRFEKAELIFEDLLTKVQGPDRLGIYAGLEELYRTRGQMGRLSKVLHLKLEEAPKYLTPIDLSFYYINNARPLIQVGDRPKAFKLLEQVANEVEGSFKAVNHFGYVTAYIELEETETARMHLQRVKAHQDALAKVFSGVAAFIPYAEGCILEIEGRLEEALSFYRKNSAFSSVAADAQYLEGRCLRKLGRWQEARDTLSKALKLFPSLARAHDELSRVYTGLGQNEKARSHLNRALEIWSAADADYQPALEARARLQTFSDGL